MSEVTVEMANTYFATNLGNSKWSEDETKKQPSLDMAENDVKNYLHISAINTDNVDIVNAVCEQALCLITNYDSMQASEIDRIKGVAYRQIDGWGAESYRSDSNSSSGSSAGTLMCPRALSFISKYKNKQICLMRG